MKISVKFHTTAIFVIASLVANASVSGQGLRLSPREVYDSIPTRSPSTSATTPVTSTEPEQPGTGGTSVSGTAPVTQPGRPVGRGPIVRSAQPDVAVVSEPPRVEMNGDLRSADLTRFLPPVGEQICDGDCVAWALAYASYSCQICQMRHRGNPTEHWDIFSPAFVFNQLDANEKGLIPIDAVNLVKKEGCASFVTMPAGKNLPTATAKVEAAAFRAFVHERARSLDDLRAYLDEGYPVVLIVRLDSDFISQSTSAEPYKWSQEKSNDFHAVTAVGYDNRKKAVKIMNSWGTKWKDQGYCWVSYTSLEKIDPASWCAEAHVVKVKAPHPIAVQTPETARTDSRSFLLKSDQRVYEKVAGEFRPVTQETDPKIIDVVCDDSDLFVLRHDKKVDIMQDHGPGSDARSRQWLHLTYGPMTNETASMLAATSESTLYILTADGDVIEYHERTTPDGELVRINPPIDDQSTTIDLRILGRRLRATTNTGKVFVHEIDDNNGRWTTAR